MKTWDRSLHDIGANEQNNFHSTYSLDYSVPVHSFAMFGIDSESQDLQVSEHFQRLVEDEVMEESSTWKKIRWMR